MGKRSAKQTKLDVAVARIHRRFGPRSLVRGRPEAALDPPGDVPHVPTGFPRLDTALGIGGLPRGKVSEIAGFATSGKTTLALKFLAQAQDAGRVVAYVDQARHFDPDYAHRCGVDLSRLLVGTPYDLAEALAMVEALARSGGTAAVVLDTSAFIWSDAAAARQVAACLGRLAAPLARSGTILLVLHDAPEEGSPALSALAHVAAVRLRLTRERWQERYGDVRGYEARVEVLQNRLGPAGRRVTIAIEFNGTVHGNGL